jgi:integrase/recombinase XerD
MTFSHLVTAFFQKYLAAECGLAANSIASYSDCIKLLINFACTRFAVQPEELSIDQFDRALIIDFLDDLERNRRNGATTRNQRLAAIKTFFHFLAYNMPELLHLNETIQAIRQKKTDYTPPPSMTIEEVNAIAAGPDPSRLIGTRDRALVKLMYNSGGRVQELADLRICDIRFDTSATVTLTGKGGKTRIIPLWEDTLEAIRHYIEFREQTAIQSDHLFLNVKGGPMTRFGIGRRSENLPVRRLSTVHRFAVGTSPHTSIATQSRCICSKAITISLLCSKRPANPVPRFSTGPGFFRDIRFATASSFPEGVLPGYDWCGA